MIWVLIKFRIQEADESYHRTVTRVAQLQCR